MKARRESRDEQLEDLSSRKVTKKRHPYVLLKLWEAFSAEKNIETRAPRPPDPGSECFQNLGPFRDESFAGSVTVSSTANSTALCQPWDKVSAVSLSADLCRPYVRAHCNNRLEPSYALARSLDRLTALALTSWRSFWPCPVDCHDRYDRRGEKRKGERETFRIEWIWSLRLLEEKTLVSPSIRRLSHFGSRDSKFCSWGPSYLSLRFLWFSWNYRIYKS